MTTDPAADAPDLAELVHADQAVAACVRRAVEHDADALIGVRVTGVDVRDKALVRMDDSRELIADTVVIAAAPGCPTSNCPYPCRRCASPSNRSSTSRSGTRTCGGRSWSSRTSRRRSTDFPPALTAARSPRSRSPSTTGAPPPPPAPAPGSSTRRRAPG
ncbi:hypothetical protein PV416_06555 [Streptomyces ipomoeae]|uniref:hypothetical protein n=1 Tax=Streptomyces ipomoeae TaxID=103232 RepID=UPI001F236DB9|nr:hypothetical protein [Streptomyces ipomoeae]MDX2692631.1 hypothetical protein [Streptomyces ipomoeae]MDX2820757.1 hypothetical protein [Streptomyces ipomoeae]MDX2837556.1 hypothetical protein [Streptomyces ipomoeae]